jgi:hypothetical protein
MKAEHEAELRNAGIVRLWLFGSTARGDQQWNPISICWRLRQDPAHLFAGRVQKAVEAEAQRA